MFEAFPVSYISCLKLQGKIIDQKEYCMLLNEAGWYDTPLKQKKNSTFVNMELYFSDNHMLDKKPKSEVMTLKEFREIKLKCMEGENYLKEVVPWDFDKCFLAYNASWLDATDKKELLDCW